MGGSGSDCQRSVIILQIIYVVVDYPKLECAVNDKKRNAKPWTVLPQSHRDTEKPKNVFSVTLRVCGTGFRVIDAFGPTTRFRE
jgi:hypothetical protein